ncbi:myozenin-2 [Astyanax mexicanus]|uniref:Myozenin-2-like n=1 Tax=Astyanax mexicanus TaxID=7994 RepID=A0A3B1IWB5_ASTMX|nr:myozenin-2 [Astyanax mexicanus]
MRVLCTDPANQRQQWAPPLCLETQGHFNLGKKISTPQDLMLEELHLHANRGSRMFHERQRRVEKFTLESVGNKQENLLQDEIQTVTEVFTPPETPKTGNPSVLAPGYSGPLKEVPHEKFNVTIVPKSYYSPWKQSEDSAKLLANINAHLPEPPYRLTPATYKCFNRAPMPFEGTAGSMRALPLPGFEMQQTFTEPNLTWERMCNRPNFNRTPAGWRAQYAEKEDL